MRFELKKLNPLHSLRANIAWGSAGIVLLLSLSLSYWAAMISTQQIEDRQGAAFERQAHNVAEMLDRGMFERFREMQVAAVLSDIQDPDVSIDIKRKVLERMQSSFNAYAWIGMCDAQGVGLVGTGKYLEGKTLSHRPWCTEGRTKPFVGDVHDALLLAKILPNPSGEDFYLVDVAAPVHAPDGSLLGVLCGHIFWDWAKDMLRVPKSEGEESFLLSKDGLVLAGSLPQRSYLKEAAPQTFKAIQAGKEGYVLETWTDGKTYLTGFATAGGYRDYEGLGWVALHRQDASLAFAPAYALQQRILIVGGVLGFFFVLLGWLQAGRIARPIQSMTQAAKEVATSNAEYLAPKIEGDDEVAHLSQAIHTMANALTAEIKERKLAEDELRKISEAVRQAGEAVIITDRQGVIQYVNPACCKITGYAENELLGKTPALLKSDKQDVNFYKELWDTVTKGEVWQGTLIDRKKDGTDYPALMSVAPVLNEKDVITHFVSIQQDMTEYNQLEEQFFQAQKMDAIGTLVGGVAHDFNNILAGIMGNTYLAQAKAGDNAAVKDKLAATEELTYRAANIIKQLLTVARKGNVELKPVSFTSVIRDTMKLLSTSIPENIVLEQSVTNEILLVNGDQTQLHQVLMNLVNNARDAVNGMQDPCLTLTVEKLAEDCVLYLGEDDVSIHKNEWVHLSLKDNGHGVGKEDLVRLFEPFFTKKEKGKGTGLGLAMVQSSVDTHGGYVDVESNKGLGTIFHLYFPLIEDQGALKEIEQDDMVSEGSGELILLVDDDVQLLEANHEVLLMLGYRVLIATDGVKAVETFREHVQEIALVLSDVVMPNMGGVEAYKQMLVIKPGLKGIFLTGYDKGFMDDEVGASSSYVVLSKPCNVAEMSIVIQKQLKHKG
ncbi:MAG: ATP-binding protein [Ghiorsea sp.]